MDKYAKPRKQIIEKTKSCPCKKKNLKGAFSISVLRFQKKDVKVAESSLSENVLDKLRNLTLIRRNAVAELVLKKDLSL